MAGKSQVACKSADAVSVAILSIAEFIFSLKDLPFTIFASVRTLTSQDLRFKKLHLKCHSSWFLQIELLQLRAETFRFCWLHVCDANQPFGPIAKVPGSFGLRLFQGHFCSFWLGGDTGEGKLCFSRASAHLSSLAREQSAAYFYYFATAYLNKRPLSLLESYFGA